MMKKIILLLVIGALSWSSLNHPQSVSAVISTASAKTTKATPSPSPAQASPSAETTTQNLKDRIEKVIQERQGQIQGTLDEISQTKRGFIGEVTRISEEALTIKNTKGSQIIPIDDSVIILKKNKKIALSEVAVENWVIVMGYGTVDDFTPKRILVSTETLRPANHNVLLGSIQSIDSDAVKIIPRNQSEVITAKLTKQTKFLNFENKTIKLKDIGANTQVLLIGNVTADGTTATLLKSLAATSK